MKRVFLPIIAVIGLVGTASSSPAQDERVQTDLSEESRARLFVVPFRVQATKHAKPGECANLGPQDLWLRIRNVPVDNRTALGMIEKGLVALDRRPNPMLHAVVFDTSGSMSLDLPQAKAAAVEYFENNLREHDKGMVLSFDDAVTLWQRVTSQKPKLLNAVNRLEVGGQTSLFDALVSTIRELDAYRERPVVVLISDGQDNASFYDEDDVLEELQRRPDLTVFTIGIGARSERVRDMLKRISAGTYGMYFDVKQADELSRVFDEIRQIIETEVVLSVVDPDPMAPPGSISVKSKNKACDVIVLGDHGSTQERQTAREPIRIPPPPLPIRYEKRLSYSHRKILAQASLVRDPSDCYDDDRPLAYHLTRWEFNVAPGRVSGCAPDIVLSHGYLLEPGPEPTVGKNESVQIQLRPFSIDIPPVEALQTDPLELVQWMLAALPEEFEPSSERLIDRRTLSRQLSTMPLMIHGTTFLEMRPRIARAMFAQPGYSAWAMERLKKWIDADIRTLEARYRGIFPGYSEEAVRSAAQNSDDARMIRARLEQPTEADLQPFLAAWLGDIEAHTLFEDWEMEATRRRLLGEELEGDAEAFVSGWRRLRALLSTPSTARILAPLVPMYESECDCVGFYRIVLPRPGLMRSRVRERSVFLQGPRLDVPPKLPFAYALVGALQTQLPGAMAGLREAGYQLTDTSYELLGPTEFHDPLRAFRETRVRLGMASPNGRVTLTADLHLAVPPPRPTDMPIARNLPPRRPRWLLDSTTVKVENDPELKKLFARHKTAMIGFELLRGVESPMAMDTAGDSSASP